MALVTNTAINAKHPGLSDNTININKNSIATMDNISDLSNIAANY